MILLLKKTLITLIFIVFVGEYASFEVLAKEIKVIKDEEKLIAKRLLELSGEKKWIEYNNLLSKVRNPILKKEL